MIEVWLQLESYIIAQLAWPSWALRLIALLTILVLATACLDQLLSFHTISRSQKVSSSDVGKERSSASLTSFRYFQMQYLSVYWITMLADWLQGTNMYTLYVVSVVIDDV